MDSKIATTTQDGKRSERFWTLPVVVAVAAAVVLLALVLEDGHHSARPEDRCEPRVANCRAPRQGSRTGGGSSKSSQGTPSSISGTVPEVGAAEPEAKTCAVTLQFVTRETTPASRVRFRFGSIYAISDDGGRYSSQCPRGGAVEVEVCGEPEAVIGPNGFKRYETSYSASWCAPIRRIVLDRTEILEQIVVLPAKDIFVQVTYADGVPYTGTLYLHAYLAPPQGDENSTLGMSPDIVRFLRQEDSGRCVAKGVPLTDTVELILPERRLGFDEYQRRLSVAELTSAAPVVVVVPHSSNPKGALEVEFRSFSDRTVDVLIERLQPEYALVQYVQGASTTSRWLSQPLPAGLYSARVVGESAYRNDEVHVVGGTVTYVVALATQCGSIRARVLNSSGKPIPGAVLTAKSGVMPSLEKAFPAFGLRGVSDVSGVIFTTRWAPCSMIAVIEAIGYQPFYGEVLVSSGGVSDMGDVYLEAARGVVIVHITGMKEQWKYLINVFQAGTAYGYPKRAVSTSMMRIEGLAVGRSYDVGVLLATGGEIVYQRIELTLPDVPVEVSLDVSALDPETWK